MNQSKLNGKLLNEKVCRASIKSKQTPIPTLEPLIKDEKTQIQCYY